MQSIARKKWDRDVLSDLIKSLRYTYVCLLCTMREFHNNNNKDKFDAFVTVMSATTDEPSVFYQFVLYSLVYEELMKRINPWESIQDALDWVHTYLQKIDFEGLVAKYPLDIINCMGGFVFMKTNKFDDKSDVPRSRSTCSKTSTREIPIDELRRRSSNTMEMLTKMLNFATQEQHAKHDYMQQGIIECIFDHVSKQGIKQSQEDKEKLFLFVLKLLLICRNAEISFTVTVLNQKQAEWYRKDDYSVHKLKVDFVKFGRDAAQLVAQYLDVQIFMFILNGCKDNSFMKLAPWKHMTKQELKTMTCNSKALSELKLLLRVEMYKFSRPTHTALAAFATWGPIHGVGGSQLWNLFDQTNKYDVIVQNLWQSKEKCKMWLARVLEALRKDPLQISVHAEPYAYSDMFESKPLRKKRKAS
jgi:hypothetical protein